MRQTVTAALVIFSMVITLAWFAAPENMNFLGYPLLPLTAVAIFILQWLGFLHAYSYQTDQTYDLFGSLSFIFTTVGLLIASAPISEVQLIISMCIIIWASRLGGFLFSRVRSVGEDQRFRDIKTSACRFFLAWTLQAAWIFITLGPALVAITTETPQGFSVTFFLGLALWVSGFGLELTADYQKASFRKRSGTRRQFINQGLWHYCQHPNYLGEIILWIGITIMSLPTLSGGSYSLLISPLFVVVLLTRVSGIPMLQKRGLELWGNDPAYKNYVTHTPLLVPKLRKGALKSAFAYLYKKS